MDLQPGASIRVPQTGSGRDRFSVIGVGVRAGYRALTGDHISRFPQPSQIPLLLDCKCAQNSLIGEKIPLIRRATNLPHKWLK